MNPILPVLTSVSLVAIQSPPVRIAHPRCEREPDIDEYCPVGSDQELAPAAASASGGSGASRALRAPTTYRIGTTARERTATASTACHQSALLKSWVENGLVNTVHIPKRLEIAPMTEHTQKTAGCAMRRCAKTPENFRIM